MKEKQNSLKTIHKKRTNLLEKEKDLCIVCDCDLYYNDKYTRRIGVLDANNEVCEWRCPDCNSEFDFNDNILYIYGQNSIKGKA
tara:strand:+ start:904 stop:1155 length:252 start_codon:yes stop_codon:yes gene_type:complete